MLFALITVYVSLFIISLSLMKFSVQTGQGPPGPDGPVPPVQVPVQVRPLCNLFTSFTNNLFCFFHNAVDLLFRMPKLLPTWHDPIQIQILEQDLSVSFPS